MANIAIVHPADPKRPKVIPADRFDPARHTRWEERGSEPVEAPVSASGLPEGFPAREQLEAAGIDTMHGVRAIRDFDVIPGIGEKREAEIVAYLEDLEDQG